MTRTHTYTHTQTANHNRWDQTNSMTMREWMVYVERPIPDDLRQGRTPAGPGRTLLCSRSLPPSPAKEAVTVSGSATLLSGLTI